MNAMPLALTMFTNKDNSMTHVQLGISTDSDTNTT